RDQCQPRIGRALDAGGDIQALGVADDGDRGGAGGEQGAAAGDVAGVFDPGGVAGVQQQVGGDAQRLLGAGGDHDVGGVGQQATCRSQVGSDLGAQFGQALGGGVAGLVRGEGLHDLGSATGPCFAREQVGGGDASGQQRP